MNRLVAALAVLASLAFSSTALADGVTYVSVGGAGVVSPDGKTRYVVLPDRSGSTIERINVHGGSVRGWGSRLEGDFGIPAPTLGPHGAGGLSHDGSKLVLATYGFGPPTGFAVIRTRDLHVLDRFALNGSFAYDALSPDARTLYLIEHTDTSNLNRYAVRAYDLEQHRLVPGRIADRTQRGWVMEGSAVTRTTSADGRWVYTLYQHPGGYPFIHALDTVRGVAHCTGLPWTGDQTAMLNVRLTLVDGGRALAVQWKNGKPWLELNTATWRLTHMPSQASGFLLHWPLAAGSAVLLVMTAALVLSRRRNLSRQAAPFSL